LFLHTVDKCSVEKQWWANADLDQSFAKAWRIAADRLIQINQQ
jgi:hypothetical protein